MNPKPLSKIPPHFSPPDGLFLCPPTSSSSFPCHDCPQRDKRQSKAKGLIAIDNPAEIITERIRNKEKKKPRMKLAEAMKVIDDG
jgi:hypothetical protein